VVIAVTLVLVVQSPVNEAIGVIAMRHDLMPAASVVAITIDWGAGRRIRLAHGHYMLVVVVAVSRVEMPVVQVVVVVTMRDARMAARFTVYMGMTGVGVMIVHSMPPFLLGDCRSRGRRSQAVWRWARLTAVLTLRRMARRQPPRAIKASISKRCGGYNS
jgi:hypothetical protein